MLHDWWSAYTLVKTAIAILVIVVAGVGWVILLLARAFYEMGDYDGEYHP